MCNIIVVDDHAIFREALKHTLTAVESYNVVGDAGDPAKVMNLLDESVDVITLDLSMGNYDAIDLIKRIRIYHPHIKIVVLSMHDQEHVVRNALASGIHAYVSKGANMTHLISAIERSLAGQRYLSDNISEMLMNSPKNQTALPHELLSSRELHVFTMLGKGVKLNQIAKDLKLSAKTISTHKARIMQKMNLASNAELIKYYLNSEFNQE